MQRFLLSLLLLLAFFPGSAHSKAKKETDVPEVFRQARYVYVEAVDGDAFSPRLAPEDRRAIADVKEALRTWNRYALTTRREDAELVFVVRKGRLASAQVDAGIHIGSRAPVAQTSNRYPGDRPGQDPGRDPNQDPNRDPNPGIRAGASGEVGPRDDFLFVDRLDTEGGLTAPIWSRSKKDGLNAPGMPLVKQIKDAVDKAYPRQTAAPPPGP